MVNRQSMMVIIFFISIVNFQLSIIDTNYFLKIDFRASSVILRVTVVVADFAALPRMSPPVLFFSPLDTDPVTALPTFVPMLRATLLTTAPIMVPKMVRFHLEDFCSASLAFLAASFSSAFWIFYPFFLSYLSSFLLSCITIYPNIYIYIENV